MSEGDLNKRSEARGFLLCLFCTACAAPDPNPAPSTGTSASFAPAPIVVEAAMPIVATVGDKEVSVEEFLAECLYEDSTLMRQVLERVVLSQFVRLEAGRLGLVLGEERLALAQAAALAQVVEQIEKDAPGLDLDVWISSHLGLDPAEFKSRLRERVERELLAQRVMRTWFLSQDRAEVRILLTTDLETAHGALKRHAGGEDFAALARELSVDRSAEDGGRAAPIIRGDTFLGTIVFETGLGEVVGPFEERGRWLLVQVVARHTGAGGVWDEVREQVEKSLDDREVEEVEFLQWKERMQSVYPVDITPLFRLAGEPDM